MLILNKRLLIRNQVLLILGITLFSINISRILSSSEGNKVSENVLPREKLNEYPIEYAVIDHYANGESVVRGITNAFEFNPLQRKEMNTNYSHPLSRYQTPLVGGDEIVTLTNSLSADKLVHSLNYYMDDKEIQTKDWTNDLKITSSALSYGGLIEPEPEDVNYLSREIATGDFDGNFRQDIVTVSREYSDFNPITNTEMNIELFEFWGGFRKTPMTRFGLADKYDWDNATIPTVVTGDIDGDAKDEIIIAGIYQNQPIIRIYDDLARFAPQGTIFYGESLVFKTFNVGFVNSWVYSAPNDDYIIRNTTSLSPTPVEYQFTILKAFNLSYSGPVEYGEEIVLIDSQGKYWNSTEGEIKTDGTTLGNSTKFKLITDRGQNNDSGLASYHHYITLQDYQGRYVTCDLWDVMYSNTNADLPESWFKIMSNKTDLQMSYLLWQLDTLTPNNIVKFDNLPRSNPNDYSWHIATKSIATSDIDGDSKDEIILTGIDTNGWVRGWVYDYEAEEFTIIKEFDDWNQQNFNPSVTTGDVDNDSKQEIIISGCSSNSGLIQIYEGKEENWQRITIYGTLPLGDITRVATGDLNGDGIDEILFTNGTTIKVFNGTFGLFLFYDGGYRWEWNTRASDLGISSPISGIPLPSIDLYIPVDLVCGDIDRDGSDEIVFTSWETKTTGGITTDFGSYGVLSAWNFDGSTIEEINTGFSALMYPVSGSGTGTILRGYTPKVVVDDVNADHFTLRYHAKDVFTSKERIVAVMAAPPTQAGISQNYEDSSTAYGEGRSVSGAGEVGLRGAFGVYLSAEWKLDLALSLGFGISINLAKGETEITFETEFAVTHTVTHTSAEIITYTGDYASNYVIFSACLYDEFIYKIIDSPDPTLLGLNWSINVPSGDQSPDVFQWEQEYYNSRKSESAPMIGSETFNHIIGYVPSYPKRSELPQIAPLGWIESQGIQVGKGGGTISVEVDLSKEETLAISGGILHTGELGVGNEKAIVGVVWSVGAHAAFSVTVGEQTMFTGEVGHIKKDNDYANFHYKYGLAIYVKDRAPGVFSGFIEDPKIVPVLQHIGDLVSKLGAGAANLLGAGVNILSRGTGYYVLNYWVDTPLYWGEDALQVNEFGDDVNQVIGSFETPGWTIFSLLITILVFSPVYRRVYLYKRRRE